MHPRNQKELADVAKLLSIIFEKSWQSGEVSGDWDKGDYAHVSKKTLGTTNLSILPLFLCKEQIGHPKKYTKAYGEQERDSRQVSWLHQGEVLSDQPSGFLWWSDYNSGQWKYSGCQLSGFCKAFDSVPNNLLSKLKRYGFNWWTVGG